MASPRRDCASESPARCYPIHVRRRLDRWNTPVLPGHRPARWIKVMAATAKLVPPRVQACQLRTAFNGWTTKRRMQGFGRCMFDCNHSEDSIEHYALCKPFHNLCQRYLGISRPPPDECLADFIGIKPYAHGLPAHRGGEDSIATAAALRALSAYSLYKLHTSIRHGACDCHDVSDAFRGFLRAAVIGHAPAMALLREVYKRPRAS